ncbi:MAG TPA: SMI1/KNR4 family protein [Gammaproteobacteria bacterium]|nr:SMI1/KNR4 family protein [Gammaproteobacteria bacterium]
MRRLDLYRAFVEKWTHPQYRPVPATPDALDAVEREFKIALPAAYREYMTNFGAGGPTSDLLHSIVEADLDTHDLGQIYSPDGIGKMTTGWRRNGMPEELVAVAGDGMGNQFCFHIGECGDMRKDDARVWFFDHDVLQAEDTANGFEEWIREFYEVHRVDA